MRMVLIVLAASATVVGCGSPSPYSRYSYDRSSYAPYSTDNDYGYSCNNNAGLLGGLAGAAGGGLLGNQFGHGTGKGLATGAGVVGGAAAGYAAGRSLEGC